MNHEIGTQYADQWAEVYAAEHIEMLVLGSIAALLLSLNLFRCCFLIEGMFCLDISVLMGTTSVVVLNIKRRRMKELEAKGYSR